MQTRLYTHSLYHLPPTAFSRRSPVRIQVRCVKSGEGKKVERPNKRGESTADFTPYVLMRYDMNPVNFCRHSEEIVVNASREHCFEIWNGWDNLVDFLDLIGEVCLEKNDPNTACLFCYYRFGDYPILQIMLYLTKTEIKENEFIKFKGTIGMPLGGIVEFEDTEDGQTRVKFRFEHAMPKCLQQVKVGVYGVENHMKTILEQNMATFKMLAEGDLEFSQEKYDKQRALKEVYDMRDAYYRSGWISTEKEYQPSDPEEFAREIGEYEMFPEDV